MSVVGERLPRSQSADRSNDRQERS